MKAQDWDYIAEGGEHAVFSYNPKSTDIIADIDDIDNCINRCHGKVLRIRKQYFTNTLHGNVCFHSHRCDDNDRNNEINKKKLTQGTDSKPIQRHGIFQQPFIRHILKPYIDIPITIDLSFDFMHHLYVNTIRQDAVLRKIPLSRRKDWSLADSASSSSSCSEISSILVKKCKICELSTFQASLQPNYRHLQFDLVKNGEQNYTHTSVGKTLSIEIKPKAGYIPYSPLIQPENRAKFFHSRFEILQQLYFKNEISKSWSSSSKKRSISNYNPLGFFSGQFEYIQKSMKELFMCPQNNLKVLYDDTLLYGAAEKKEKGADSIDMLQSSVLNDIFQTECSYNNCNHIQHNQRSHIKEEDNNILQTKIQELVSIILHRHSNSLLQEIRTLQKKFDVLDYDGVTIVYRRLIELCNGSSEEAESLIDSSSFFCRKNINQAENHFKSDRLRDIHLYLGTGSQKVASLLNLCEEVEEALQRTGSIDHSIDEMLSKKMDSWHHRAKNIVQELNTNDCVGLLQNWLVSLMMCDISLIISVSRSNDVDLDDDNEIHASTKEGFKFYSTSMNELKVLTQDGSMLHYQIRLIDLDGKPAKKLRNRDQLEREFSKFCR